MFIARFVLMNLSSVRNEMCRMIHTIWVEAAARFHERIAVPVMMQNTLPPLASNDFVGLRPMLIIPTRPE